MLNMVIGRVSLLILCILKACILMLASWFTILYKRNGTCDTGTCMPLVHGHCMGTSAHSTHIYMTISEKV